MKRPFPIRAPLYERVTLLAFVAGALYLMVLARRIEPDPRGFGSHEQLGLAPCSFLAATGHPCLTCGMTTSFAHMADGEVVAAFRTQPAGAVLFVATLLFFPLGIWAALSGHSLFAALVEIPLWWYGPALLALLGGAWIYTILVHASGAPAAIP